MSGDSADILASKSSLLLTILRALRHQQERDGTVDSGDGSDAMELSSGVSHSKLELAS